MSISAPTVSAALRRVGFNPLGSGTSRMREGIRVTGNKHTGSVRVVADLDNNTKARSMAADAAEALAELGYRTELNENVIFVYERSDK